MRIGFIGLGIMGKPMALNLLKGGYQLSVYARREASMVPLREAGAQTCASPSEVARIAEISFVLVSDTADVEHVVLGENGFIHGARAGTVLVDMSTIAPANTRVIAERLQVAGVDMLDAPVSGGDIGAINATLSIMVGGKPEVFERVKPLFELLGKNIVLIGGNGAGQVAKACNQIVVAMTIEAVAEALLFAKKNGVDASRVRDALMGGFAASRILEVHGKRMLDDDFAPGFKLKLHQKDMRIVMETAHQLGMALPGAALVTQQMNALVGSGDGELDSAAIMKAVRRVQGGV
ncbi:MAG: 2-hydroxy-3-oxopropionate reductase [Burkholderiales bacterium]